MTSTAIPMNMVDRNQIPKNSDPLRTLPPTTNTMKSNPAAANPARYGSFAKPCASLKAGRPIFPLGAIADLPRSSSFPLNFKHPAARELSRLVPLSLLLHPSAVRFPSQRANEGRSELTCQPVVKVPEVPRQVARVEDDRFSLSVRENELGIHWQRPQT